MGNLQDSKEQVISIYNNIEILTQIDIYIKLNHYDINRLNKTYIKSLYKTFYYPDNTKSTLIEHELDNYYVLRNILEKNIKLYNKYINATINIDDYLDITIENLKPTLEIIF